MTISEALATTETHRAKAVNTKVPPIYGIFGSKGGVGKSMTAHASIDHLLNTGRQVLFIETDTDNPDVWRCLERDAEGASGRALAGVVMHAISLDEREGWMDLVDIINEHRDRVVVINTAARMTGAIRKVLWENPEKFDLRDYMKPARAAMQQVCKDRMVAFGQAGQASKLLAKLK